MPSFIHSRIQLLVAAGLLVGALPAGAQAPGQQRELLPKWTVDAGGGVLVQPTRDGGNGPAVSVSIAQRVGGSPARLSGLFAASRIEDVRAPRPDRYVVDRDWRIAAIGADVSVLTTGRFDLAIGAKGGVLWSRDRRVGVVGTPLPDPDTRPTWEERVALIPDARVAYQVAGPFALAARAALVQHLFTDDFVGPTGALVSVGAALRW